MSTECSGLYTKRDFQISEQMQWHKLTRQKQPELKDFPEIMAMPLFYDGNKPMAFGDKKFVVPIAKDDGLPVAPPFCEGTYYLFTPQDAWNWVSEVLSGTDYNVESIGMLWNRSKWFISAHLKELEEISIGDGRKTRFQLNFSGGLDRKMSPQCELSSTVIVCQNTLSLSRLTGKVLFNEKATINFKTRLDASKKEVETAVGMTAVFKTTMDTLAQNACNTTRARNIFAGYITPEGDKKMSTRTANTVDTLTKLHTDGIGNRGMTEFDLLNAYTQLGTRGMESEKSKVSPGRQFASSEFGNGAADKAEFATLLTNRTRLETVANRGGELVASYN